jgi:hypothetical protein
MRASPCDIKLQETRLRELTHIKRLCWSLQRLLPYQESKAASAHLISDKD